MCNCSQRSDSMTIVLSIKNLNNYSCKEWTKECLHARHWLDVCLAVFETWRNPGIFSSKWCGLMSHTRAKFGQIPFQWNLKPFQLKSNELLIRAWLTSPVHPDSAQYKQTIVLHTVQNRCFVLRGCGDFFSKTKNNCMWSKKWRILSKTMHICETSD